MSNTITIRHPKKREFFSRLALRGETAQAVLGMAINLYLKETTMDPIKYAEHIAHYQAKISAGWTPSYGDEGVEDWPGGIRTKCTTIDGSPIILFYAEQPGDEWGSLGSHRMEA
jgi:hypothetical protein